MDFTPVYYTYEYVIQTHWISEKCQLNECFLTREKNKEANDDDNNKQQQKMQYKQHVKLSVSLHLNGNNNSPIISLLPADEEYPFSQIHIE